MKSAAKFFWLTASLGGLLLGLGGCAAGVDDGGPGPVVYGDVGYVGPWYYPGTWFGGGGHEAYVHPPYGGGGHGPSIPDHPRPAPSGGGGARGGGGGGGHVGGGGGGGGDRRH